MWSKKSTLKTREPFFNESDTDIPTRNDLNDRS